MIYIIDSIPSIGSVKLDIPEEYDTKVREFINTYRNPTTCSNQCLRDILGDKAYHTLFYTSSTSPNGHMGDISEELDAIHNKIENPEQYAKAYLRILEAFIQFSEMSDKEKDIMFAELYNLNHDIFRRDKIKNHHSISVNKKIMKGEVIDGNPDDERYHNIPALFRQIIDKSIKKGIYYNTNNDRSASEYRQFKSIVLPKVEGHHVHLYKRNEGKYVKRNDEQYEALLLKKFKCSETIAETLECILEDLDMDASDRHYADMKDSLLSGKSFDNYYIPGRIRNKIESRVRNICESPKKEEDAKLYSLIEQYLLKNTDVSINDEIIPDIGHYSVNLEQDLRFSSSGLITTEIRNDNAITFDPWFDIFSSSVPIKDIYKREDIRRIKMTSEGIFIQESMYKENVYREINNSERQILEGIFEHLSGQVKKEDDFCS